MKFTSLICPYCGLTLTVSEHAPARLTCPRCLASIEHSAASGAQAESVPVVPMEQQVRSDHRANVASIILLVPIIIVGVAFAGFGNKVGLVLLAAIAAALGLYFVFVVENERGRAWTQIVLSQQSTFMNRPTVQVASAKEILAYAPPAPRSHEGNWGFFVAGFVYVVGIAIMVVVGTIASFKLVAMLLVVPALIAALIPSARGFSAGVLIGVGICVVLPFGICFAMMASK